MCSYRSQTVLKLFTTAIWICNCFSKLSESRLHISERTEINSDLLSSCLSYSGGNNILTFLYKNKRYSHVISFGHVFLYTLASKAIHPNLVGDGSDKCIMISDHSSMKKRSGSLDTLDFSSRNVKCFSVADQKCET
jgi:hypothetical protein